MYAATLCQERQGVLHVKFSMKWHVRQVLVEKTRGSGSPLDRPCEHRRARSARGQSAGPFRPLSTRRTTGSDVAALGVHGFR